MSIAYWLEYVDEALCEAGITATEEQLKTVAEIVQKAHEMYGEAHGHEYFGNPMQDECDRLRRELKAERAKVVCPVCKGAGSITNSGPYHSATSQCYRCYGEGRV